jgi:hypothetical protein
MQQQEQLPFEIQKNPVYANAFTIVHSPGEFVIDAVLNLPGMKKAEHQARITMNSSCYKGLLQAMQKNCDLYESKFGKIFFPDEQVDERDLMKSE